MRNIRPVRIGPYTAYCATGHSVFANNTYSFKPDKVQLLNLRDYAVKDSFTEVPFSERDRLLTQALRENQEREKAFINLKAFEQKPMYIAEDGVSMLLPLDNKLKLDYLTYRSSVWKDFIYDFADQVASLGEAYVDQAKYNLVDYSANVPFASVIRHDGRMHVDDSVWRPENIGIFRRVCGEALKKEFLSANLEEICPPLNGDKSVGNDTFYPDGRPLAKDDFWMVPADDAQNYRDYDVYMKRNFAPFKIEWLLSGGVLRKLEFFLNNCHKYWDPSTYVKAARLGCVSTHCEAYRMNNPDLPLIDLKDGSFKHSKGLAFKKNRDAAYEVDGYKFQSMLVDDEKYSLAYRRLNPSQSECMLKKRPMFPSNNASFMPPFLLLFRAYLHRVEGSSKGFPSLNAKVLARFTRWYNSKHKYRTIVSFDRRTSEQFITDNFDHVLQMFDPQLSELIRGLCTIRLPSLKGQRVVCGGLASGTAPTTFLNAMVGCFEMCNCISMLTRVSFSVVCAKYFDCVFGDSDFLELPGFHILVCLGTDDQLCLIGSDTELEHSMAADFSAWANERSLTAEMVQETLAFGMKISTSSISYNAQNNVSKIFLLEKNKVGDRGALNYDMRFTLQPEVADVAQRLFDKYKFGSISTYSAGAMSYLSYLKRMSYSVAGEFNQYSPKEKAALDIYLSSRIGMTCDELINQKGSIAYGPGFDNKYWSERFIKCAKYPVEGMRPLYNMLNEYLYGGSHGKIS